MRRLARWKETPYGRKLRSLHAWNGWLVLLLALTGVLLSVTLLRGVLGEGRVWLKQAHIALGLLSLVVLALYAPLAGRHGAQLKQRRAQRANRAVVLALLLGWGASGLALWQFRSLPPAVSNAALWVHDLLSWIGIPYALYHSVVRSRWAKDDRRRAVGAPGRAAAEAGRAEPPAIGGEEAAVGAAAGRRPAWGGEAPANAARGTPSAGGGGLFADSAREADRRRESPAPIPPAYSRRTVLRWGLAGVLAVLLGPRFVRWLGSGAPSGTAGSNAADLAEGDPNRMVPVPEPLPGSLPPAEEGARGQFRVYTVTKMPEYTTENWSLEVTGLVERPLKLGWEKILGIPREAQKSDFHCVTGWSVYGGTWEGIRLSALLEKAGVRKEAAYVKFFSGDGVYTDSLTLEQARMDDVLVAMLLDGRLLPQQLGGPARLLVPRMYAYKSVKWLNKIELIAEDHTGYWEARGYDKDAWVKGGKPGEPSGA
ncbi:hypothetical protein J31TS4_41640 [Paenibacillus sp. J31TS4]|uniref:molybdopterin-dependent oxidoreductase n=1 Tax=Paenibacillus sp. J31TS4 TaxID=2807195 RepID=UPI001B1B910B|nr:molybdopterin-dependent oxidoreductase [Paenibacillus sp. J31TS4]GIP40884.1 hypothetical protein J31TS4_41640 [Paenibacillus sp. J31TS4]